MGGLFCNPAGHTTLAQEKGGGGADGMHRGRGGVREDLEGLYYYLPTYTFSASLRLRADGLSLFFPIDAEVSPHYILSASLRF